MNEQLSDCYCWRRTRGSFAGELLASGGRKVLLFDEKLAWEKPCGGGLTHKALFSIPFWARRRPNPSSLELRVVSPAGRRARFEFASSAGNLLAFHAEWIVAGRALRTGVDLRKERVIRISGAAGDWHLTTPNAEYRASHLMLAAGAAILSGQFLTPISPDDLMVTADTHSRPQLSGADSVSERDYGYIWVFPRPDHLSAGIAAKMGETSTADLRRRLEQWLSENEFSLEARVSIRTSCPLFVLNHSMRMDVCGEGWTMIGDSAGLVDPITGEVCTTHCALPNCRGSPADGTAVTISGAAARKKYSPS